MDMTPLYRRILEGFQRRWPNEKPTQLAMKQKLGVGQSDLSRYKSGDRTPTLRQAIQLAEKMDVSVEWLLTGRGPRIPLPEVPESLEELALIWPKLTPKMQNEITGYAKLSRAQTSTASPERHAEVEAKLAKATRRTKTP